MLLEDVLTASSLWGILNIMQGASLVEPLRMIRLNTRASCYANTEYGYLALIGVLGPWRCFYNK